MIASLTGAIQFLIKGGPVMVPLGIASICAVTVMIERAIVLQRAGHNSRPLMDVIERALAQGAVDDAVRACIDADTPVARVLAAGLRARRLPSERLEKVLEESAMAELPELKRRLVVLDTVVTVAPLLGLLGTVTGMIRSFGVMALSGVDRPHVITGGVAEALIATACGLGIAITTLVAYNWLSEKVREITAEMEIQATRLVNLLAESRCEADEAAPTRA